MADRCVWCDLDGRQGCPVHVDRWPLAVLCALIVTVDIMLVVALAALGVLG